MVAFVHSTAFLLGAALLISCSSAAPATAAEGDLAQTQALDYPNEAGASRCYYNFQHYEEGDRIVTNEPCLNCTCHKRMLMCYLRVCPFTKAVGQDCTVEKRPDQCCPVITCPQVPVDILTSSTTTEASASTAVGHPSTYGCTLEDNTFYPDGVQMPSDTKTPCELCYCIRNHTACVRQECTLNVEGCRPIYQEGVCCPVRYDCEYNELITTERPSTGGLLLSSTTSPLQCRFGETLYNDGELIESDKPCESCYCMRGDIVCAVRSCGEPMAGKDCEALPPPEGECCPTAYQCANGTIQADALSTESAIIMHPANIQTQSPPTESEPEQPVEQATKTGDTDSMPEVTTGAPKEDDKEQENVEKDKTEVEEQESLPEHVESDPLDADDLEDEEALSGIIPVDDAKPDNTNIATESPADHTSAPFGEADKETSSQYEKEAVTAGPVDVEYEGSTELHSKPVFESPDPDNKVPLDLENAPVKHVDPEHIRDEQEVGSTDAKEQENVEDKAPIHTVSTSDSENKVEQTEANPLESETSIPQVMEGAVPDSESEASDNADARPAEGASDDDEAHDVTSELEIKPQEEILNTPVSESAHEETDLNVPKLPESLDHKKDDDLSSHTNDVVAATDSKPAEVTDIEHQPSSSESSELESSKPEDGNALEETPKPSEDIESEGVKKEPVPPRKEDAVPEEPRPTQHAEGSMTKAEDSIPTDVSHTPTKPEVPANAADIDNTQNTESTNNVDINKPTEILQSETLPSNIETEVQSTIPEVPSLNHVHAQETHDPPTFGDEIESESATDKVDQPVQPTHSEESASPEMEMVPNVVVTESETETSVVSVSEEGMKNEAETPVSGTFEHGNIANEASPVETENTATDPKPEDDSVPEESFEGGTPAEVTDVKHEDESKEPENSGPTNDETVVPVDNESSTKENEIVERPEENSVPVKEQAPSTFEELSPSTEKYIPVESDQDQTEINEIIPELTDAKPDEKVPTKESQTETAASEESSTDTLIKLGNEGKPEETANEEVASGTSDLKPVQSQPSELENVPHHDNSELNVFQDDLHDPVELDPTDFDDQLEDSEHHIHNEVPSENEIVDDHQLGHGGSLDHKHPVHLPGPIGVIPGEGDCLVDGKTYTNNSEIPSRSPCHKVCTCMSSIVHCQGIDCPPPPPQLANCMPVHQGDLCCPVYTCDGNTHESPETDNQVVATDKATESVAPEVNPVPSEESEVVTEQPHDVWTEQPHEETTSEQPHEVASELPNEATSEQPHEVVPEQPHEVAPEQPHEVAPEQPHEVAPEQPHEVASEQSHEMASEQPHEVASEQPHEMASEQPNEVTSEQPHEVASEQNHVAESDQPQEAGSEQPHEDDSVKPHEEASEQPSVAASEQPELSNSGMDNQPPDTPIEASEQTVEGGEESQENSHPEASEATNLDQEPASPESESSTNDVETSQSSTEESHLQIAVHEPTEDIDPLFEDNKEQTPTEGNVEPEVQTSSPEHSVGAGEKLETQTASDSNDLPSEVSVESHPSVLTDEGETLVPEHEHSSSTDSPAVDEKEPSKHEGESMISEQEGGSNAEEGGELDNNVTEIQAIPAVAADGVVDQVSTEIVEDHVAVTSPPAANPSEVDSASSVFEGGLLTKNDNSDVKHSVDEPVKETVESHDKPFHSTDEIQENTNEESALDDGSNVDEVGHDIAVPESESHTVGNSLHEANVPEQPEEPIVSVTDLPVEEDSNHDSDDNSSNVIVQQPQSPADIESSSSGSVEEGETATVVHEVAETSDSEGSNESVKDSGAEVASIETHNENPSVTENMSGIEETQTNHSSVSEDDKHVGESAVLSSVNDAVTDGYQEGDISEPATESSHEPGVSEAETVEEHQHGGSETEAPAQEGEPGTPSVIVSDNDSNQTPIVDPVGTENDNSEEPLVQSEVSSGNSVESEKEPSSELPSSEVELITTVPEYAEEQVTTMVYKDHEESFESGENLSEPIEEHQETIPEVNSSDIAPVIGNEEHSQQPIEQENEGHLEVESTELPVTEAANSYEEPENNSETTSDLIHRPEQEHEMEQPPLVIAPEQVSDTEDMLAPESPSEQTIKPEEEGPSSESEEHVHTEEISGPVHEENTPEPVEDHKEPISHAEVPIGSEDLTHHEEEHSTQSGEEPQKPEHTSQESDNNVQEAEQPNQEVELQESILPHLPIEENDDQKPSLPIDSDIPTEDQFPTGAGDMDYDVNEDGAFGPGTCRYGGKVYVSAQQIPRDDPCDFCFCFRSDIICLQQSCPPPIHRCHQEPIQGYCCPRYQCPVSMATTLNLTSTTTTTTTTLPPHFFPHAYQGAARQAGCLHRGRAYSVGDEITSESGPCLHCICGSDGQMKCDPVVCSPEPMLRKMMEAAASHRRR